MRELFGFFNFGVVDACFEPKYTSDKAHDSAETPLEASSDIFSHEKSPSLGFDDIVLPNSFVHSHVFPFCSLPSQSHEYYTDVPSDPMICDANAHLGYDNNMFDVLGGNADNFMSLGHFSGYNTSIDAYCMYLMNAPKKNQVE